MFFKTVDTAVIDAEAMPWMPFVPYTDLVQLKLLKVDPIRGEWITLLKAPEHMQLPKHHHSGTVNVYTISGKLALPRARLGRPAPAASSTSHRGRSTRWWSTNRSAPPR